MATRRMISEEAFEDDTFCAMPLLGRLTWIGMIVACADDQGRMIDNPAIIRAKVYPLDQDITDGDIDNILVFLSQEGKIARYIAGKKRLIQVVNWWRYQTPSWAMPSKYLPPPGWKDREKYHTPGFKDKVTIHEWDAPGGFTALPSPLPSDQAKPINELSIDELRLTIAPNGAKPSVIDDQPFDTFTMAGAGKEVKNPRALQALKNNHERQKQGIADLSWLDEYLWPLAQAFIDATGIHPIKMEYSKWKKDLIVFYEEGIGAEKITSAVQNMTSDGMTIKSPGSIFAVARNLTTKADRDDGEHFNRVIGDPDPSHYESIYDGKDY